MIQVLFLISCFGISTTIFAAHTNKAQTNKVKVNKTITNRWVRPIVRGILDNEIPESICRQIDQMPPLEYPKSMKIFSTPCKCSKSKQIHGGEFVPWEQQNQLANQLIKDFLKKCAEDACKPVLRPIIQDLAHGKEVEFHQEDWGPNTREHVYFPTDVCLVDDKLEAEEEVVMFDLNHNAPAMRAYNFAAILNYINKLYPR